MATEVAADTTHPEAEGLSPLGRGELVGRYMIVEELARGGMGIVYVAYDPELDRKVALKCLLPRAGTGGTQATARLQREARTMARLTHPSIVTIHDVGVSDGRVYLAMELIVGQTLDEWLAAAPRPWQAVVDVLWPAASGLAAAHAAGVVHRDFKPRNVLVADDGRVLVVDFGIAFLSEGQDAAPHGGTPDYIAPEQRANQPVDARADQYSFCVTLFRAVTGVHPFGGETVLERASAAQRDALVKAPRRLPSALRRVLERGLAAAPDHRFASMADLLAALERARRPPWRAPAIAAALGIAALSSWLLRAGTTEPCADLPASQWDVETQTTIEQAFRATGTDYAVDTWARVQPLLDRQAVTLAEAQRELCHTHEIEAAIPDAEYHRRMACLAERTARFDATIQSFAAADVAVLERAVPASEALVQSVDCRASGPLGDAQTVAQRSPELAQARVLIELERNAEAREAIAIARSQNDLPLAELLELEGQLHMTESDFTAAREWFHQAFLLRLRTVDDGPRAEQALQLGRVALARARRDEAFEWAEIGRALLQRRGEDRAVEARLLVLVGQIVLDAGDHALAIAYFERARERADPSDAPVLTNAMTNRAIALSLRGDDKEAVEAFRGALAIQQERLGPDHPDVGRAELNLGAALIDVSDLAGAKQHLERALAILSGSADTLDTAIIRYNLGVVQRISGDLVAARTEIERARAIWERILGPRHPRLAGVSTELGMIMVRGGNVDGGLERLEHARAIIEESGGADHPGLVPVLALIGETLRAAGRDAEAAPVLARARALCEAAGMQLDDCPSSTFALAQILVVRPRERERALTLAREAEVAWRARGDETKAAEAARWSAAAK